MGPLRMSLLRSPTGDLPLNRWLLVALLLGLGGCLDPVEAPTSLVDASDGSVVFKPDTSTQGKDGLLADGSLDNEVVPGDTAASDTATEDAATDDTGSDDAASDTVASDDADAALADDSDANDAVADDVDAAEPDTGDPADGGDVSLADDATLADADAATDGSDDGLSDSLNDATTPAEDATAVDAAVDATDTDIDQSDATLADAATPDVCGDQLCGSSETCATCPADCGACPIVCGDGSCAMSETCETCPADCGVCPGPVCTILTSEGCPPGEQCFPDGSLNLCWVGGTKKMGEACGALDCEVGALCVGGICRTLCSTELDPLLPGCLSGVPCQKLVGGSGPLEEGLGACQSIAGCDPWLNTGCSTGQVCLVEGAFKVCAAPGTQTAGTACETSWVCAKGLVCVEGANGVDPSVLGTCRPICDMAVQGACGSATCWPTLGPDKVSNPYGVGGCVP